jgi:ketosteroid isomerase-like protein
MNATMTTAEQVRALSEHWVQAERAGDVAALDALTVEDYTVVGPVGFVLTKQQSLDRYREGTFVTHELAYDEVAVRVYGDAAVSVGVHIQRAEYGGNPADGRFRSTHIAVRDGDTWRLAGMHLSPIGGPPPFAPRPDQGQAGGRTP